MSEAGGELVTRAQIARRLHLSRARAAAMNDAPGFPAPIGHLGERPLWRWAEVRAWAEEAAGEPHGPSEDGLRIAHIRDHFREAGFRLKIAPDGDAGWVATRVAPGRRSTAGQTFTGGTALEAAESALGWLETHH